MRFMYCRVALLAFALFGTARCADRPTAGSAAADPGVAENAAGESCAAKLSPEAGSIYRAAAPDTRRDTDLASLLRQKVMAMVFSDQIQPRAARPAAEQAAACLQLLQH